MKSTCYKHRLLNPVKTLCRKESVLKKYYTNAPCNVAREEAKPRSLLALISAGAVIFTLLRMSFLLFPIENNGFEEIAVMAFAPSASEISADDGKLPTETAIEVSEIPNRKVIPLKGAVTSGYNKREDPFGTGKTELHMPTEPLKK